ncbi:hypothetical protein [Streptomyces orinoci]|uniref:Secreted protein n=1 Tax=Streptomyces orinoci TaxID=67339 RepID=A0ABV3JZ87_STRON|nr:hypothetical protein [Streptomyces orinoci]
MIGKRGVAGIALSSLTLLAAAVGGVPAAQAHDRTALECAGQENITYGPGLGLSSAGSARVTVDGTYHCTDAAGRGATARYHTVGETGSGCLLFAWNRSKEVLHFADGATTVITYRSGPSVRVAGVNAALLRGTVTGGRGKGAAAEKVIETVPGSLPTECVLGAGIRHTTGLTRLSIRP